MDLSIANILRRTKRMVADLPGVLPLMERITRHRVRSVRTPEGGQLVVNAVFHSLLATPERIADYEPDVRSALERLLQPGMIVYDIGANVGVFTLLSSARVGPTGTVYAFEPDPHNRRYLERSVLGVDNVAVDSRAISSATGTDTFDRRGGAFSGRLIAGNTSYDRTQNLVSVSTVTVDDLVQHEGFQPPDVLKIDVEGNEGPVLAGAAQTLALHHPTVLCELHAHLGDHVAQSVDLLRGHGYRLEELDGSPWPGLKGTRGHVLARWG